MTQQQRSGLVLDLRVGEMVTLRGPNGVDSEKIVLILEHKEGRKARFRIKAAPSVRVSRPEKEAG